MKKRKFQNGGDVDDKRRGLKASEGEKVGFFERLRMGNIDDPTSEAYKRFGAGRGRSIPAPDMTPYSETEDAKNLKKAEERPANRSTAAPEAQASVVKPEAPQRQSFGQAFAAARKAGDKTFTFGGKKYTTELAKPAAKPSKNQGPSTQDIDRLEAATTAARRRDERTQYMQEQDARAAARRAQEMAEQRKQDTAPKPTGKFLNTGYKEYERIRQEGKERRAAAGMKKGGIVKSSASKRADGCAVRGKTRGKIV